MAWLEKRDGTWFICHRDEQNKMKRLRASTDKVVARAKLGEFETAQARGEKYADPFKQHRNRPLSEHLKEYIAELRTLGRDAMYVYNADKRLAKLAEQCGWQKLADISADSFCDWRQEPIEQPQADAEDGKIGARTQNQYLATLRSFCRWCVKRKRMATNPMDPVEAVEESDDIRRQRRALSDDELRQLLAAVTPERRRLYAFALSTGLRRQELADLQWGDIRLNAPVPFIQLRANATKSRRADTLPLRGDIAAELKLVRGDAGDNERVFTNIPTMDEFRSDLTAAGIPFTDEAGRRFDFHAFRTTLGSMLNRAGVPLRTAMAVMRHTDAKLTLRTYNDMRIFDVNGSVEKLQLPTPGESSEAATGTNGEGGGNNLPSKNQGANQVAIATGDRLSLAMTGASNGKARVSVTTVNGGNWQSTTLTKIKKGKPGDLGFEPNAVTLALHWVYASNQGAEQICISNVFGLYLSSIGLALPILFPNCSQRVTSLPVTSLARELTAGIRADSKPRR